MVVSVGHSRESSQQYDWDGLKRGNGRMVIFQYTIDGYGMLRYEDQTYKVEPGTAMVLRIPHDHRYWLPKESDPWEFIFLCLNGTEIMRMFRAIEQRCVPLIKLQGNSQVFSTFLKIYRLAERNDHRLAFQFSHLAYEFALRLLDELKLILAAPEEPPFLPKAKDYIYKNLHHKLSLDDIARASGYSKYHFCRLFKKYEGISPKKYEQYVTIRQAAKMLISGDECVKEIAYRSGFSDVSYFCKVFKDYFQMSPTEYRQRGI